MEQLIPNKTLKLAIEAYSEEQSKKQQELMDIDTEQNQADQQKAQEDGKQPPNTNDNENSNTEVKKNKSALICSNLTLFLQG